MKRSKSEAAESRRKIVETAASAFRAQGVHGGRVADIMAAAGFSHGGFYRHFASKEQLLAEACAEGMRSVVEVVKDAAGAGAGQAGLREIIERYLSADHLDDRSGGCPLTLMGSELARADPETREAASKGLLDLVAVFQGQFEASGHPDARGQALFTVSALIGAVTLSRITPDADLANTILEATERGLVEPAH